MENKYFLWHKNIDVNQNFKYFKLQLYYYIYIIIYYILLSRLLEFWLLDQLTLLGIICINQTAQKVDSLFLFCQLYPLIGWWAAR